MFPDYFFTSMTRIADLSERPFQVEAMAKKRWETGDYVVGEVCLPPGRSALVELVTGRMATILGGDRVVGALGMRCATLEAVGDWHQIAEDGRMELLTEGGLMGKATSISFMLQGLPPLLYKGHLVRDGQKVQMSMFIPSRPQLRYSCPTLLIIGTSMSCGKTSIAQVIVREMKKTGLKVTGAKLAGAGQYHDILSMGDAGADRVFDFVDVGLPSSICPPEKFRGYVRHLLSLIAADSPDVVVVEIGASPLEPYNGEIVMEELKDQIYCTVLCASDAYAVVGAVQGFGFKPDVIGGIVTNTTAGIELVEKLTGITAISPSNLQSREQLSHIIQQSLLEWRQRQV